MRAFVTTWHSDSSDFCARDVTASPVGSGMLTFLAFLVTLRDLITQRTNADEKYTRLELEDCPACAGDFASVTRTRSELDALKHVAPVTVVKIVKATERQLQ